MIYINQIIRLPVINPFILSYDERTPNTLRRIQQNSEQLL